MKKMLIFVFIMAYCLVGYCLAKETPLILLGIETIKVDEVKKWLDDGEEFILLDARNASAYEENHLPMAESCVVNSEISLAEPIINKAVTYLNQCAVLNKIDKKTKIVVYCNSASCFQSPKASLALVKMGYKRIYWMRNGMNLWKQKGYPVE